MRAKRHEYESRGSVMRASIYFFLSFLILNYKFSYSKNLNMHSSFGVSRQPISLTIHIHEFRNISSLCICCEDPLMVFAVSTRPVEAILAEEGSGWGGIAGSAAETSSFFIN